MDDHCPRIALTPGEPAGIGPDLAIYLANENLTAEVVCICDPELISTRAKQLNTTISIEFFQSSSTPMANKAGIVKVLPVSLNIPVNTGKLDINNAQYVLECLTIACNGCLSKQFDAMTTGPVQKSIINDAGIQFSGHTEFLATLCDHAYPVMMMANDSVRVALVTTHIPLNQVSTWLDQNLLKKTISIVNSDLHSHFGINNPRILVCGLNPHAGENGHLGREEMDIINPVINDLKKDMTITGPLPADTVFTKQWLEQADVIISMYHDQGLPALKALGFGETVNITLGLPIIRTSVDHGTALDLAGTGKAKIDSLRAAICMAIELINNRMKPSNNS